MVSQFSLRLQLLYQLLKRQVLVSIGSQRRLPHSTQNLSKSGIARKVCAQNQIVNKKPYQPLGLHPTATRNRRAHHDVVLTCVAVKQYLEGRQQGHEQGHSLPTAQFLERPA